MFAALHSRRTEALSSRYEAVIGLALVAASMAMLLILFMVNQPGIGPFCQFWPVACVLGST